MSCGLKRKTFYKQAYWQDVNGSDLPIIKKSIPNFTVQYEN